MNPFVELMQAGAFIMLLFAAVLIMVVIRNVDRPSPRLRIGPIVIGVALSLFAAPIYAGLGGSDWFARFSPAARIAASVLLPIGLYLLAPLSREGWAGFKRNRARSTPADESE